MGVGTLNVWTTMPDNPCKLMSATIFVTVFTCDGQPLEWAGRRYELLEGHDGHLEVELPPGIYYVRGSNIHCPNGYTDSAVVRVNCGETVCVTLMVPSLHRCLQLLDYALRLPMTEELIEPELIKPAIVALDRIGQKIGKPVRVFELENSHLELTSKMLKNVQLKK